MIATIEHWSDAHQSKVMQKVYDNILANNSISQYRLTELLIKCPPK
jgi:hypothetical protein